MTKQINWGILGCGWIAERFANDLKLNTSSLLHAVASREPARSKAFAKQHGALHAYSRYQDLLANDDIDIVYVALPHTFHFEWARAALEAGKAILVEKPFTLNAEQAASLFDLAERRGLFAMEAFWTKFYPPVKAAVESIQNGTIGAPKHLRAAFNLKVPQDPQHRLYNKALGGGALLDVGVYPLELALWLFGEPQYWDVEHRMTDTEVDAYFRIDAKWQTGQSASLSAALDLDAPSDVLLTADKGSLYIPDLWIDTKSYELTQISETAEAKAQKVIPQCEGNGLRFQAREAERCIKQGLLQSPQHSWTDTLTLLRWCDAIRQKWDFYYLGEHQ